MPLSLRAPLLLALVAALSLVGVRVVWEVSASEATTASASASFRDEVVPASVAELTEALEERQAEIREAASRSRAAVERTRRVWPANGPLTGLWAEPRTGRLHSGLDIDGDTGDPTVATAVGVVSWAGPAPQGYGGYGLMVLIENDGYQTLYAHLSRVDVKAGTAVVPGQIVGLMGATGNVTGSHLHFETRVGGKPVDPAAYLPPRAS